MADNKKNSSGQILAGAMILGGVIGFFVQGSTEGVYIGALIGGFLGSLLSCGIGGSIGFLVIGGIAFGAGILLSEDYRIGLIAAAFIGPFGAGLCSGLAEK